MDVPVGLECFPILNGLDTLRVHFDAVLGNDKTKEFYALLVKCTLGGLNVQFGLAETFTDKLEMPLVLFFALLKG